MTDRKEAMVHALTKLMFLKSKLSIWLLLIALSPLAALAQEGTDAKPAAAEFSNQLKKVTRRKVGDQKFVLKYKLKKGDVIRWQHDHRTAVESRFGNESEKTATRARPDYQWTVQNVDSRGNIRFDIKLQRIKVLEQQGEAEPVFYNSEKHDEAPDSCLPYQERVGRVCSTYSISTDGIVVNSTSHYHKVKLGGVGDNPVVAFPKQAIGVGHKWDVNSAVRGKDQYGAMQQVKLRVRYVLDKVVDGKAHITFATEVLTPQIDESVRSQIVTHMTRGFVVFDIGRGMLTHRELRWDERVIGYQGPESYMHYTAYRTETVEVEKGRVAKKAAAPVAKVASATVATPKLKPKLIEQTHTLLQPLKQ